MAYFSSLVLIASFVGMSIGRLAARRRFPMAAVTPLLLTAAVGLALWMRILVDAQKAAITLGQDAPSQRIDFGANIAGVVVGGLLEYTSLILGYRVLLLVALALYALSMLALRWAGRRAPQAA